MSYELSVIKGIHYALPRSVNIYDVEVIKTKSMIFGKSFDIEVKVRLCSFSNLNRISTDIILRKVHSITLKQYSKVKNIKVNLYLKGSLISTFTEV